MSTSIQHYINDCIAMLAHPDNYDSHGYVFQLYVSNAINPFFICTGYDIQDALENALELDLLKDWNLDDLLENITLIEEITA